LLLIIWSQENGNKPGESRHHDHERSSCTGGDFRALGVFLTKEISDPEMLE
jgi:hypothetical protein